MRFFSDVEQWDSPVGLSVAHVSRGGFAAEAQAAVQEETLLDMRVNGRSVGTLRCSASNLGELVLGRLVTEGLVSSLRQVECVRVCTREGYVEAVLAGDTSCGAAERLTEEVPPLRLGPVTPVTWSADAVFRIADEFALDKTAHARTRGAHSAYLCDLQGRVLCLREDIGRHNAFDKAVGWALVHGVDLRQCMLYTSGRVPTDMASKAIRAGIPVLVSKSVPTDKAVALAKECRLTLVCEAKPTGFDVVCDPLGIVQPGASSRQTA